MISAFLVIDVSCRKRNFALINRFMSDCGASDFDVISAVVNVGGHSDCV